jgi:uncharacterized protein
LTSSSLRIGVTELRRRPGNRAEVRRVVPLDGMAVSTAAVPEGADGVVEVTLESLSDGVTARGTVTVPWEGECRRCLETTSGTLVAPIDEVYKDDPDEGETLPISGDAIDLGQVVHDAVILGLPLAPLCREDCAGPEPGQFPVGAADAGDAEPDEADRPVDPRWAALEELRFDSGAGE